MIRTDAAVLCCVDEMAHAAATAEKPVWRCICVGVGASVISEARFRPLATRVLVDAQERGDGRQTRYAATRPGWTGDALSAILM